MDERSIKQKTFSPYSLRGNGLGDSVVVDLGNAADIAAPEVLDRISMLKANAVFDRWSPIGQEGLGRRAGQDGRLVSQAPEIKETDLNPERVYEKGVMVLDALRVVD